MSFDGPIVPHVVLKLEAECRFHPEIALVANPRLLTRDQAWLSCQATLNGMCNAISKNVDQPGEHIRVVDGRKWEIDKRVEGNFVHAWMRIEVPQRLATPVSYKIIEGDQDG